MGIVKKVPGIFFSEYLKLPRSFGCQMLIDDPDCLKIFEAVFIYAQKGCIIAPIKKKNEKFISSNRSSNASRGLQ